MAPALLMLMVALAAAPVSPGGSSAGADRPGAPGRADNREVMIGPYRLKPKASGGYRVQTDSFIAWIAADGGVNFEKPPRLPGPAVLPAVIAGTILENKTKRSGRQTGDLLKNATGGGSLILADDDLRNDPQHAKKMAFLADTATFREEMQRRNEGAALGWFRKRVEEASKDPRLTPAQRRANLFALWLDCDEGERGVPARRVVEQTIRRQFPTGSAAAYSAQELAAFNQQVPPPLRFDPYAVALPVAVPVAVPAPAGASPAPAR